MPDRLTEIRARMDAATPGPWSVHDHYDDAYQFDGMSVVADEETVVGPEDRHNRNLDLIAHAPEDIAWLLAEVAQLRADLERAREVESDWQLTARDAIRAKAIDGSEIAEILRKAEDEADFWRLAAEHFRRYVTHRTPECLATGTCTCGLVHPTYIFGHDDGTVAA